MALTRPSCGVNTHGFVAAPELLSVMIIMITAVSMRGLPATMMWLPMRDKVWPHSIRPRLPPDDACFLFSVVSRIDFT